MNQYLQQLDHPLAAFGVKQKHPQTIDEAVSATLEMETYVTPKMAAQMVSSVQGEKHTIAAVGVTERLALAVEKLAERLEKLGSKQNNRTGAGKQPPKGYRGQPSAEGRTQFRGTCWLCFGKLYALGVRGQAHEGKSMANEPNSCQLFPPLPLQNALHCQLGSMANPHHSSWTPELQRPYSAWTLGRESMLGITSDLNLGQSGSWWGSTVHPYMCTGRLRYKLR